MTSHSAGNSRSPAPSASALFEEFALFVGVAFPTVLPLLAEYREEMIGMLAAMIESTPQDTPTEPAWEGVPAPPQRPRRPPEFMPRVTPPQVLARARETAPGVVFDAQGQIRFTNPGEPNAIPAASVMDAACRTSVWASGMWGAAAATAEVYRTADPNIPDNEKDWSLPALRQAQWSANGGVFKFIHDLLRAAGAYDLVREEEASADVPFDVDDPAAVWLRETLGTGGELTTGHYPPGAVIPPHSAVGLIQAGGDNAVLTWAARTVVAHIVQDVTCVLSELRDAGVAVPDIRTALAGLRGLGGYQTDTADIRTAPLFAAAALTDSDLPAAIPGTEPPQDLVPAASLDLDAPLADPPLVGMRLTAKDFRALPGSGQDVAVTMSEARDIGDWSGRHRVEYVVHLHGAHAYIGSRDKGTFSSIPDGGASLPGAWAWATAEPRPDFPPAVISRSLTQHVGAELRRRVDAGWEPRKWQDTAAVFASAAAEWRKAIAARQARQRGMS